MKLCMALIKLDALWMENICVKWNYGKNDALGCVVATTATITQQQQQQIRILIHQST